MDSWIRYPQTRRFSLYNLPFWGSPVPKCYSAFVHSLVFHAFIPLVYTCLLLHKAPGTEEVVTGKEDRALPSVVLSLVGILHKCCDRDTYGVLWKDAGEDEGQRKLPGDEF